MSDTSLHDIAPRIAEARDVEKWNIWIAGDEPHVKDGDKWAETVSARHWTTRCYRCGNVVDCYDIRQRFLVGCNRGRVGRIESERGRHCAHVWHSRHS